MGRAEKRQRKKENTRAAREARARQVQRQKRKRTALRVGGLAVVAIAGIVIVTLVTGDDDGGDAASDTTTTSVAPTALPEGCVDTVPDQPDERPTFDAPPEVIIDPDKTYTATIATSCGDIVLALDAERAPTGANNFLFLARQGFYDGLTWHRVVPDFVIQGGDPVGDGTGGTGYQVQTEVPANGYQPGDVAWAKAGPDPDGTAGSQFFIVTGESIDALNAQPNGSYQYGKFATVTEGLENARKIESLANGDGPPSIPVYILSVTVNET